MSEGSNNQVVLQQAVQPHMFYTKDHKRWQSATRL